jgi:hypothetical protein
MTMQQALLHKFIEKAMFTGVQVAQDYVVLFEMSPGKL